MSVDETVKALRTIVEHIENGGDGLCFDICGECRNAADQLEQLGRDLKTQIQYSEKLAERAQANANLVRKREKVLEQLQAENERLKAEKPVRCGECEFYGTVKCALDDIYENNAYSYCSYGKRRDAE